MTAILASPYGAYAAAAASLAAVWVGAALGAAWDRITTAARARYAPGSHRR